MGPRAAAGPGQQSPPAWDQVPGGLRAQKGPLARGQARSQAGETAPKPQSQGTLRAGSPCAAPQSRPPRDLRQGHRARGCAGPPPSLPPQALRRPPGSRAPPGPPGNAPDPGRSPGLPRPGPAAAPALAGRGAPRAGRRLRPRAARPPRRSQPRAVGGEEAATGGGQAAMATRKAGSRLETEIERCRSESQWERIPSWRGSCRPSSSPTVGATGLRRSRPNPAARGARRRGRARGRASGPGWGARSAGDPRPSLGGGARARGPGAGRAPGRVGVRVSTGFSGSGAGLGFREVGCDGQGRVLRTWRRVWGVRLRGWCAASHDGFRGVLRASGAEPRPLGHTLCKHMAWKGSGGSPEWGCVCGVAEGRLRRVSWGPDRGGAEGIGRSGSGTRGKRVRGVKRESVEQREVGTWSRNVAKWEVGKWGWVCGGSGPRGRVGGTEPGVVAA